MKQRPAGAEKGGFPPTDRNPQKTEVKSEEGNRKREPSLSVTGDLRGGRQAIGGEIKNYSLVVNPSHQQVSI